MEGIPNRVNSSSSTEENNEFKQPFEVKQNWEIKNQEKHNAKVLDLLNTGNLKLLQSLPAIGQKTAYTLFEHR